MFQDHVCLPTPPHHYCCNPHNHHTNHLCWKRHMLQAHCLLKHHNLKSTSMSCHTQSSSKTSCLWSLVDNAKTLSSVEMMDLAVIHAFLLVQHFTLFKTLWFQWFSSHDWNKYTIDIIILTLMTFHCWTLSEEKRMMWNSTTLTTAEQSSQVCHISHQPASFTLSWQVNVT